jgi:hypothetical protein
MTKKKEPHLSAKNLYCVPNVMAALLLEQQVQVHQGNIYPRQSMAIMPPRMPAVMIAIPEVPRNAAGALHIWATVRMVIA